MNHSFIDDFWNRYNIVNSILAGNKTLNPDVAQNMEKQVALDLGMIKREYDDVLDKATIESYDETHMKIDMYNGSVLHFSGVKRHRHQEVSAAGIGFTV